MRVTYSLSHLCPIPLLHLRTNTLSHDATSRSGAVVLRVAVTAAARPSKELAPILVSEIQDSQLLISAKGHPLAQQRGKSVALADHTARRNRALDVKHSVLTNRILYLPNHTRCG